MYYVLQPLNTMPTAPTLSSVCFLFCILYFHFYLLIPLEISDQLIIYKAKEKINPTQRLSKEFPASSNTLFNCTAPLTIFALSTISLVLHVKETLETENLGINFLLHKASSNSKMFIACNTGCFRKLGERSTIHQFINNHVKLFFHCE